MDHYVYKNILANTMIRYADKTMPLKWRFMYDNDPNHTSRTVKSCLDQNMIAVLKRPAQSADLNPIDILWNDVENHKTTVRPKNVTDLWNEIQKDWYSIPTERCMPLVGSMPRRCAAVVKNNGYPTKILSLK